MLRLRIRRSLQLLKSLRNILLINGEIKKQLGEIIKKLEIEEGK